MRSDEQIGKGVLAGVCREDGKYVCTSCLAELTGEGKGDPIFHSSATAKMKCKLCKKKLDRFGKERGNK